MTEASRRPRCAFTKRMRLPFSLVVAERSTSMSVSPLKPISVGVQVMFTEEQVTRAPFSPTTCTSMVVAEPVLYPVALAVSFILPHPVAPSVNDAARSPPAAMRSDDQRDRGRKVRMARITAATVPRPRSMDSRRNAGPWGLSDGREPGAPGGSQARGARSRARPKPISSACR